jgi:hypothetical protein
LVAVIVAALLSDSTTFQLPWIFGNSAKAKVTVQPLIAVDPVLVTVTST